MVIIFWEVLGMCDFVGSDKGLCIPQVVFRFPIVFHSGIPFPSDQEDVIAHFSPVS